MGPGDGQAEPGRGERRRLPGHGGGGKFRWAELLSEVGGSRTSGAGLGGRSLRDAQSSFREDGDTAKWADPG